MSGKKILVVLGIMLGVINSKDCFSDHYIDNMWGEERVVSMAASSNFNSWPNQNGTAKASVNLIDLINSLGISADNQSKNPCIYKNDNLTIYLKSFTTNLEAQKSRFIEISISSVAHLHDSSPIEYDSTYGDICWVKFNSKEIFGTRHNFSFSINSNDSLITVSTLNSIISALDALPDKGSTQDLSTLPTITEIVIPDSLIPLWAASPGREHEFKILINNPDEFLGGSLRGDIPGIPSGTIRAIGKKEANEDTIRFKTLIRSQRFFPTDLDSFKVTINVGNERDERADTTFWITRRIP